MLNTWSAECLLAETCYTYVHNKDYFYDVYAYEYYDEEYECEYTLSTVCDPDWKDIDGDGCDYYDDGVGCDYEDHYFLLYATSAPDGGVMTGLNCPVCGCGENGPIRMGDRDTSRSLAGGNMKMKKKNKVSKK